MFVITGDIAHVAQTLREFWSREAILERVCKGQRIVVQFRKV